MNREQGFSVVELVIVVVLTAALSGILFQFSISYTRMASVLQSDSIAFVERLNASDYLRENLSQSAGLVDQPSLSDANVLTADPSNPLLWNRLYVLKDTFGNKTDITPLLYFARHSQNKAGVIQKNGNNYRDDEYILYHNGPKQELRIRRLANPEVLNSMVTTTCPAGATSTTCPEDILLANDIASVSLRYFSRAGNELTITSTGADSLGDTLVPCADTSPPYATCTGATFDAVEVVELTLHLAKMPEGTTRASTKSATIIRVALRDDNS